MAAYLIAEISVTDPELYEEYKKLTPAAAAAFDGKFLVRGGSMITLEGDWNPDRIVILEFPSAERAREFWNSEMYARARSIRQKAAKTKMIIIEGV
jgi:uncharacterized protein (DUF1330 family)